MINTVIITHGMQSVHTMTSGTKVTHYQAARGFQVSLLEQTNWPTLWRCQSHDFDQIQDTLVDNNIEYMEKENHLSGDIGLKIESEDIIDNSGLTMHPYYSNITLLPFK